MHASTLREDLPRATACIRVAASIFGSPRLAAATPRLAGPPRFLRSIRPLLPRCTA